MHKGEQVIHSGDGYQIKNSLALWGIYLNPERDERGEGVRTMSDMPADWLDDCTRYQVQTLYLSYTGIRSLPAPLAQHHHLQRLHLSWNGLRDVPPVVFTLTTLRVLWLDGNRLERLPEDIYQLVHLQQLYLHNNPSLKELPPQMGHRLKQLRWFRCSSTGLPSEELDGGGHRLRGWQLARHGPGALPPHQTGGLVIDCLVIYQEADKETVVTKGYYGRDSLCGQLEEQGDHCCTPASDVDAVQLGLQNCKTIVLCFGRSSFHEKILSKVEQSKVVVVKLYKRPLKSSYKKELLNFNSPIEYQDNPDCLKLIIQELYILVGIPPQIVAQGAAAVKVYQEAVQNGATIDKRCCMLIVGAERIGKTSLIKLLTGNKFNPKEKSTHVMNVFNVKVYSALDTWKEYQTKDGIAYSEHEKKRAASEIAKKLKENESMENLKQATSELVEEILLSIWDFAGQGMYYTTHKVFLSSASIFIVAFDLSKEMNQPATEWVEDDFSNGQVLEFWLDSIYAYTASSQPLSSQSLSVLLVGTHAGQVNQTQIKNTSDYIKSMLDRKSHLKDFFGANFENRFYTVENSLKIGKNDEAKRLKGYIEKEVIPRILENRGERPMRWLEFEKKLKLFQTNKNEEKNLATLNEVKELAIQCKVILDDRDDKTLMVILQFLHNIGSIIYYGANDTAMRDLVILKPEWLLDIFKRIIIVPRPRDMDKAIMYSWQVLKNRHILDRSLMDYALDDLKDTKSSIIYLMKKYDLICERVRAQDSETTYYVPFILVQGEGDLPVINKRPHSVKILSSNTDTTFLINFHGFLPSGLFHQLAVKTLKLSEDCRKEGSADDYEPEIYYRYLDIFIQSNHLLSLEWMKNAEIKVILKKCSDSKSQNLLPEPSVCYQVLGFLRHSLTDLKKMGLKRIEYDFEIDLNDYPQLCRCNSRLSLESCLISKDGKVPCPSHPGRIIHVEDIQQIFSTEKQGLIDPDATHPHLTYIQTQVQQPQQQQQIADAESVVSLHHYQPHQELTVGASVSQPQDFDPDDQLHSPTSQRQQQPQPGKIEAESSASQAQHSETDGQRQSPASQTQQQSQQGSKQSPPLSITDEANVSRSLDQPLPPEQQAHNQPLPLTAAAAVASQGLKNKDGIVLLVNDEWGTSKGGISTINRQIGTHQDLQGHLKVYCMVVKADQADIEDAQRHNVTLIKCPFDWEEHFDTVKIILNGMNLQPFEVKVVIGHADITYTAALTIKRDLYPESKYISFFHVIPEDCEPWKDKSPTQVHAKQKALHLHAEDTAVNAIVSVGPRIHQCYFHCLEDCGRKHLEYLPYPEPKFYEKPLSPPKHSGPKRILTFGRVKKVSKLKGYDLLAMAVGELANHYYSTNNERIVWVVCGVPDEEAEETKNFLFENAKSYYLDIKIYPYLSHDDIIKELRNCWVCLMGSRTEPFGLVGLEAIIMGVPTLVTSLSGLAELLLSEHFCQHGRQCVVEMPSNFLGAMFNRAAKQWKERIQAIMDNPVAAFEAASRLKQAFQQAAKDGVIYHSHQKFIDYCLGN